MLMLLAGLFSPRSLGLSIDARHLSYRSEGLVVTGVLSQHEVELHVVDFVSSLSLESLQNDAILLVSHLHAEVVKDGLEAGESDKSRSVTILVLEVRLDQKAAILHISGQSCESSNQNLFLCVIQNVLGVQDRGCIERIRSVRWVLFKCFICEDSI